MTSSPVSRVASTLAAFVFLVLVLLVPSAWAVPTPVGAGWVLKAERAEGLDDFVTFSLTDPLSQVVQCSDFGACDAPALWSSDAGAVMCGVNGEDGTGAWRNWLTRCYARPVTLETPDDPADPGDGTGGSGAPVYVTVQAEIPMPEWVSFPSAADIGTAWFWGFSSVLVCGLFGLGAGAVLSMLRK